MESTSENQITPTRAEIEKRIEQQAYKFDLSALHDLLRHLGYEEADIEYRSHDTLVHQCSVVGGVTFHKVPRRRVVVLLNLGWLGPQSALPNYFRMILAEQQDDSFSEFLGLFCHRMFRSGIVASFPERDPAIFRNWPRALQQLRCLLGLRSTYTTHWVFSQVFPELEVAVSRTILEREMRSSGMELGTWELGDGSVGGGISKVPVSAVAIQLFADQLTCGTGEPWSSEAMRRIEEHVLPALAAHGSFLEVKLVLRDQSSFMILQPHQYLGYEPIKGGPRQTSAPAKSARTIVLFQGEVPSSS